MIKSYLRADFKSSIFLRIGELNFDEPELHVNMLAIVTIAIVIHEERMIAFVHDLRFECVDKLQLGPVCVEMSKQSSVKIGNSFIKLLDSNQRIANGQ